MSAAALDTDSVTVVCTENLVRGKLSNIEDDEGRQEQVRPRENREVRLVSYDLTITPRAALTWAYDVFGNAVASATFQEQTRQLVIISTANLELAAVQWPIFDIAAAAISY